MIGSEVGSAGPGLYGVAEKNKSFSEEWAKDKNRLLKFPVKPNAKIMDITTPGSPGTLLWEKFKPNMSESEFADHFGIDILKYPYQGTEAFVVKNSAVLEKAQGVYREVLPLSALLDRMKHSKDLAEVMALLSSNRLNQDEQKIVLAQLKFTSAELWVFLKKAAEGSPEAQAAFSLLRQHVPGPTDLAEARAFLGRTTLPRTNLKFAEHVLASPAWAKSRTLVAGLLQEEEFAPLRMDLVNGLYNGGFWKDHMDLLAEALERWGPVTPQVRNSIYTLFFENTGTQEDLIQATHHLFPFFMKADTPLVLDLLKKQHFLLPDFPPTHRELLRQAMAKCNETELRKLLETVDAQRTGIRTALAELFVDVYPKLAQEKGGLTKKNVAYALLRHPDRATQRTAMRALLGVSSQLTDEFIDEALRFSHELHSQKEFRLPKTEFLSPEAQTNLLSLRFNYGANEEYYRRGIHFFEDFVENAKLPTSLADWWQYRKNFYLATKFLGTGNAKVERGLRRALEKLYDPGFSPATRAQMIGALEGLWADRLPKAGIEIPESLYRAAADPAHHTLAEVIVKVSTENTTNPERHLRFAAEMYKSRNINLHEFAAKLLRSATPDTGGVKANTLAAIRREAVENFHRENPVPFWPKIFQDPPSRITRSLAAKAGIPGGLSALEPKGVQKFLREANANCQARYASLNSPLKKPRFASDSHWRDPLLLTAGGSVAVTALVFGDLFFAYPFYDQHSDLPITLAAMRAIFTLPQYAGQSLTDWLAQQEKRETDPHRRVVWQALQAEAARESRRVLTAEEKNDLLLKFSRKYCEYREDTFVDEYEHCRCYTERERTVDPLKDSCSGGLNAP